MARTRKVSHKAHPGYWAAFFLTSGAAPLNFGAGWLGREIGRSDRR